MVIENSEEAKTKFDENYAGCGKYEIFITEENISDLREGKLVAVSINDEYSVFIKLEK